MRFGRDAFNPPRELAASSGKLIMMSAAENASPANHCSWSELLLQIIEMQFYLAVDVSARRPAEQAKPADDELQQQGRHQGAFGVMQPIAIAPMRIRRPAPAPIPCHIERRDSRRSPRFRRGAANHPR